MKRNRLNVPARKCQSVTELLFGVPLVPPLRGLYCGGAGNITGLLADDASPVVQLTPLL